jgi:hypothetical protein
MSNKYNPINEIEIGAPNNSLSRETLNIIKDSVINYIKDIIQEDYNYFLNHLLDEVEVSNGYSNYDIVKKPEIIKNPSRCISGKIRIKNIDEYCQYYADEYGWTVPDIRVYFYDGKVKEYFTKKKKYK